MDYLKSTWRLINHPPAKGSWNMAVDEAILEAIFTGEALPTLRLYAWQPACLSLGHAQAFSEVNTEQVKANGWDIVRRPTGGRAILHVDELTYSVIVPLSEPRVRGGVLESYLRLSEALLEALRLLGLNPQANQQPSNQNSKTPNPVCFEVPSNYEITVNGKKLIGSAQARRKDGLLQHGALPLYGDLTRIIDALNFPDPAAVEKAKERLLAHATTVESELGFAIPWEQASQAFQDAFSQALNLDLEPADLTEKELARAKELVNEKYAHPSWTERI
ncbi:MAG TPA: biotin/lipoate A/B protein ligase family protein [Brevefilum fermentans]|jgi:lipoate-protein ligase A|uniref:Octanoyltransferase LipM n=1 Tax=Candidatus Brevifilum fermentans TaxID=1986204 RepID=A0A1Y6K581_9CHLR|nr:biotin/lipoate A/B protein ligase family protein [Brevefilum fermentans]OQB82977.1 MAG: Octanoyltransferase LipM [Chloroflexi bacterium ADurb.Bin120]SMX54736.1 Octanoyltransferase LipM [Brevefilum fermentans]HOM67883.1 biotin/lipoate A/B protein ligase family protein [Brevefilum fermentans]HQA27789.1 biotin/lipoate A/B protein ligase family protein [Brevefilum fermentans]